LKHNVLESKHSTTNPPDRPDQTLTLGCVRRTRGTWHRRGSCSALGRHLQPTPVFVNPHAFGFLEEKNQMIKIWDKKGLTND
jgi:hypothetical protein